MGNAFCPPKRPGNDSSQDDSSNSSAEDTKPLKTSGRRETRKAIVGESYNPVARKPEQSFPKTPQQRTQLLGCLTAPSAWMFSNLDAQSREAVIAAFRRVDVKAGQTVITQGANVGPTELGLFILAEPGNFSVNKQEGGRQKRAGTITKAGEIFGELALLYDAPRSATVTAEQASALWAIDRDTFNYYVKNAERTKIARYEQLLKTIDVFSTLSDQEIATVADSLRSNTYERGKAVIRKGAVGDEMYIVEAGSAQAQDGGTVLATYGPATFFGERALITRETRACDVVTTAPTTLLVLKKDQFDRLLGPLAALQQRAQSYRQGGQVRKSAFVV